MSQNQMKDRIREDLNAGAAVAEGLKDTGADAKEVFARAVESLIASAFSFGDHAVEATREQIRKLETRLEDEKTRLAQSLREALEGPKEAGTELSEKLREKVESAVTTTKLKRTELLGLTREIVKRSGQCNGRRGQRTWEKIYFFDQRSYVWYIKKSKRDTKKEKEI